MLRPFLIVVMSFALSVTSVGWGMASVSNTAHSHADRLGQQTATSSPTHDHEAPEAVNEATCAGEMGCGSEHSHSGKNSSCCAMNCHIAIPAMADFETVVLFFARALNDSVVTLPAKDALATSLDRPPRFADI